MLQSIRPARLNTAKLYPQYVGPFQVVQVIGDKILSVLPYGHPNSTPKLIHSDRARLSNGECVPNPDVNELLAPFSDPSVIDPNLEAETNE